MGENEVIQLIHYQTETDEYGDTLTARTLTTEFVGATAGKGCDTRFQ